MNGPMKYAQKKWGKCIKLLILGMGSNVGDNVGSSTMSTGLPVGSVDGFDVGDSVGHSGHEAHTEIVHFNDHGAGLAIQNDSQSHTINYIHVFLSSFHGLHKITFMCMIE